MHMFVRALSIQCQTAVALRVLFNCIPAMRPNSSAFPLTQMHAVLVLDTDDVSVAAFDFPCCLLF
jgi:hypothetical protein